MSNTIRRKNQPHLIDYDEVAAIRFEFFNKQKLSFKKVYQKSKARFHSDKYNYGAPKRFRKELNKEFRVKNKMILTRNINEDNQYVYIPFKHNARWLWF